MFVFVFKRKSSGCFVYAGQNVFLFDQHQLKPIVNQGIDNMIQPIRELVSQVVDLTNTNQSVITGVNILKQMFQTPRGLVCYTNDQHPTLPLEPCIKDAPIGKLKTFGRKPTDLAEERERI